MMKKFATQVDANVLTELRSISHKEGRHIQALLHEALVTYLEARRRAHVRPELSNTFQRSLTDYGDVYNALVRRT